MNDARSAPRLASSTLATGVVAAFLAVASLIGLVDGADGPLKAAFGAGWRLRGTLVPAAEASAALLDPGTAARTARPPLQGPKNPV